MLINGKRALAYTARIDEIRPIPDYDRVEHARVGGWWIIVSKADNFKVGDICVYFEIDSKMPETELFAFMAKRKYRVKTIKMCKVYSQGLIMPLSAFGFEEMETGIDLTDKLGITYYVEEDNIRKSSKIDPQMKYKVMAQRHQSLFRKPFIRWMMRREWGRRLLFVFFGRKRQVPTKFPSHFPYVKVTDEERVENMPWILEDKEPWIKTTKIDGTSTTFILERKGRKFIEYVCSRNVRQLTPSQKNFHTEIEGNVYWMMAEKYKVFDFLKDFMNKNGLDYAALQGETAGPSLQGNPHGFDEIQFFGFNLIRSDVGRINSIEAKDICAQYDIPWVPIVDEHYILPDDFEEFKLSADGPCEAPGARGMREGYVYRSLDGQKSFKNVSRKYLLK